MTAVNTVAYTVGAKSEMRGTGFFSGLKLGPNVKDRLIGSTITGLMVVGLVAAAT